MYCVLLLCVEHVCCAWSMSFQVAVEAFSGPELQYELLEGKWKLLYTTASDVVSPAAARLTHPPLLQIHTPFPKAQERVDIIPRCLTSIRCYSSQVI